jgi:hypothetical protein
MAPSAIFLPDWTSARHRDKVFHRLVLFQKTGQFNMLTDSPSFLSFLNTHFDMSTSQANLFIDELVRDWENLSSKY